MNEVRNGVCAFPEEETKMNGTMDILKINHVHIDCGNTYRAIWL